MWFTNENKGINDDSLNKRQSIPQTGDNQGNIDIYKPTPQGDPNAENVRNNAVEQNSGNDTKTKLIGAGLIAAIAVTVVAGYYFIRR